MPTFSIRSLKIKELDCPVCPYCERQARCEPNCASTNVRFKPSYTHIVAAGCDHLKIEESQEAPRLEHPTPGMDMRKASALNEKKLKFAGGY